MKRSLYIRKFKGIEDDAVERFFGRAIETPFANQAKRIKEECEKFADIMPKSTLHFCYSSRAKLSGHWLTSGALTFKPDELSTTIGSCV
jgi:hypothetical protein